MDPWLSLCEQVDTRLNRLATDAAIGAAPEDAVSALQTGLKALAKMLRGTIWPDADKLAKAIDKVASEITSPNDADPALAHIQELWSEYQIATVGEVSTPESREVQANAPDVPHTPGGTKTVAAMLESLPISMIVTTSTGPLTPEQAAIDDAEDLDVLRSDSELATMFISEALDHLSTIEATVLQLESDPTDQKLLNDVFRPFHTVKGNAGALSVKSVQEFAHKVENLLDLARGGSLTIGPEEIELILESVDMLTGMISALNSRLAGQPWEDRRQERAVLAAQIERTTSFGNAHASAVAAIAPVASSPKSSSSSTPLFMPDMTPPSQAAAPPASTPAPKSAAAPPPAAPPPATVAMPKAVTPAGDGLQRRADDGMNNVKVDTRKLDSLVDMVGELVIIQSLITEDPAMVGADERLSRNLAQLGRIASDLQRNAMSMRMVPVRQTFQKMARLVRDLSKKSGKPVDLVLSGEDTELDRKVVEEINDPLMHMIRNSMDHGIEAPGDRQKAGKNPAGRLSLSASHQGGNIVIAISDDGRGLHADKILAKAVERGLVPPGASLPLSEVHQLIFKPGFSTAEKITEISGRGVGMDVVRRNIESLRGRIEIQTEPGKGTTFAIKLPLTLAIVEGLLLRVGDERFVMPTFSIRESLRPKPERVHTVQGVPRMIQVRDSLLPLINLAKVFNIHDAISDPCEATVVVIEDDGRFVAVLVDQLVGKQEVVIKSLGPAFAGLRGVAGGAILGDGRIGLILDAGGVIGLAEHGTAQAA
jgi:two-component system chemotaxis sensor kinase CheA